MNTNITASPTTLSVGDSSGADTCTLSGGSWYCPVTLANSNGTLIGSVNHDGYVQEDYNLVTGTTRTDGTDAQRSDTVTGVKYAYKLANFTAEETADALTPTTVTLGDTTGQVSCTVNTGTWYCATPTVNSDDLVSAVPTVDGFVQQGYTVSGRDEATDPQITDTVAGIEYGFKITDVTDEIGNSISGATITTGDSYGVTCTESDDSYYCLVPLANTGIEIQTAKNGFVTSTSSSFSSDRTANTDSQQTTTVSGIAYTLKVVSITDELGYNIMPTDGEGSPFSNPGEGMSIIEQHYYDNAWYLAASGGPSDLAVSVSGYVYGDIDGITPNSSSQQTVTFAHNATYATYNATEGLLFPLKVTLANELEQALSLGEGDGYISFGESSPVRTATATAYFADVAIGTIAAEYDGYLDLDTGEGGNSGLSGLETSNSYQTIVHLSGTDENTDGSYSSDGDGNRTLEASGLEFGLIVTVRENWETGGEGYHNLVDGATVSVGDDYDTGCTESGEGMYYCAPSIYDDSVTAKIVRSGYTTGYANYPDRDDGSDSRGQITAFLAIPGDTSYPYISSDYPTSMAEGVPVNIHPYVIFSKEMDISTLTSSNIYIEYGEGEHVDATVQVSEGNRRATIIPDAPLSYGEYYHFIVESDVADLVGQSIGEGALSNEFNTESGGGSPSVLSTTPVSEAEDVSVNVQPTITFSKAINPDFLTDDYFSLHEYCECEYEIIPISIQALNGNTKARIITDEPLQPGTNYILQVDSDLEDTFGNDMGEGFSTVFATAGDSDSDLEVTGISAIKTYATANSTYEDGFAWILNVTTPIDDDSITLKFSDFVSGSHSINANNIRFCTTQGEGFDCDDDGEDSENYIYLDNDNQYPEDSILLDADRSSSTPGRQIQIRVEMKVPTGTAGGSYSGSYGILTNEPV